MKKHFWKIFILVAILALGASFLFAQKSSEKANEGVVLNPHIKGNKEASVKLVEYSDFQCPACAQMAPVIDDILATYGDFISFEYRHFPLVSIHRYAVSAARATEAAAQQGKFWEMHDKLFAEQGTWGTSGNPEAFFVKYAEELGLDVGLFRKHLSSSMINDAVLASFRDAQEKGLTGTPTIFLNDERLVYSTYGELVDKVREAVEGQEPNIESITNESGELLVTPEVSDVRFEVQ